MMHRITYLVVSALMLSGCATLVVDHVTSPAEPNGVFYALPRTVLRVSLKVDRTAKEGAEFVQYAAIFAPGNKVVCETPDCSGTKDKKVEYAVQDGVTISSIGIPDPDQVYLVKFSGAGTIDQSIGMTWNEQGLLSAANASVTNRATDIVMSGVKLAATLGTKGAFGASATAVAAGGPERCVKDPLSIDESFVKMLKKHAPAVANDLIESYCAVEVKGGSRLPYDPDLLTRATIAYQSKIVPLVNGRRKVLDGTSLVSDAAAVLPQIEAELGKRLAILYVGTKSIKTWEGTLEVAGVDAQQPKTFELLKIDPYKGICIGAGGVEPPDARGFPDGFHDPKNPVVCGAATVTISLHWDYYPDLAKQLVAKVGAQGGTKLSFRYRIPAQAKVWIEATGGGATAKKGAAVLSIAQLGKVIALPAERHSKTLTYDLAFIEATGALKSFKLGATGGVDATTIDSLTETSGMVLDAEAARKKERKAALDARKTAEDELTVLTREEALLTLRDTICTLKQKYGLTCDDPPK